MRSISQPSAAVSPSTRRRGGVRGTRAASGPPVPAARKIDTGSNGANSSLLLEADEVGRILAIGRTKTYQLIAHGELPVVRIGRCVRVPLAALTAWIDSNTSPVGRV